MAKKRFKLWETVSENIELLAITMATVGLTITEYFQLISISTEKLLLPTLLLLLIAVLRQRALISDLIRRQITMEDFFEVSLDRVLLDRYPESYIPDINGACTLHIIGTNLRRHFPDRFSDFEQILGRGGHIYATLTDESNAAAVKYAAQQDQGPESTTDSFQPSIISTKTHLRNLMARWPKQVNISQTSYPLPFGLDGVNIDMTDGVIYVRYFPLFGKGDLPIIAVRPHETKWFNFFRDQIKKLEQNYASPIKD